MNQDEFAFIFRSSLRSCLLVYRLTGEFFFPFRSPLACQIWLYLAGLDSLLAFFEQNAY